MREGASRIGTTNESNCHPEPGFQDEGPLSFVCRKQGAPEPYCCVACCGARGQDEIPRSFALKTGLRMTGRYGSARKIECGSRHFGAKTERLVSAREAPQPPRPLLHWRRGAGGDGTMRRSEEQLHRELQDPRTRRRGRDLTYVLIPDRGGGIGKVGAVEQIKEFGAEG